MTINLCIYDIQHQKILVNPFSAKVKNESLSIRGFVFSAFFSASLDWWTEYAF